MYNTYHGIMSYNNVLNLKTLKLNIYEHFRWRMNHFLNNPVLYNIIIMYYYVTQIISISCDVISDWYCIRYASALSTYINIMFNFYNTYYYTEIILLCARMAYHIIRTAGPSSDYRMRQSLACIITLGRKRSESARHNKTIYIESVRIAIRIHYDFFFFFLIICGEK